MFAFVQCGLDFVFLPCYWICLCYDSQVEEAEEGCCYTPCLPAVPGSGRRDRAIWGACMCCVLQLQEYVGSRALQFHQSTSYTGVLVLPG